MMGLRYAVCACVRATRRSFDGVVMMIVPRSGMAADVGRAGSRLFLAEIGAVPRPVESRGGRRAGGDAVSSLCEGKRRDCDGGGEADQSDCLEHGSLSLEGRY